MNKIKEIIKRWLKEDDKLVRDGVNGKQIINTTLKKCKETNNNADIPKMKREITKIKKQLKKLQDEVANKVSDKE